MNRSSLNGASLHAEAVCELPLELKEMLKGGLALLWRSFEYARDLNAEITEFAVDRDDLYQAGLSAVDLRWLIARGYVESTPKSVQFAGPKLPREKNWRFAGNDTGFVLTNAGAVFAVALISRASQPKVPMPAKTLITNRADDAGIPAIAVAISAGTKPSWDRDRKELHFGEWVIKQFRWAAINQETILMAFEEDGWPARIDDPLPQKLNQDPKARLHDTIKCLNRNHKRRLLRFNGDGTGTGILWEILRDAESES